MLLPRERVCRLALAIPAGLEPLKVFAGQQFMGTSQQTALKLTPLHLLPTTVVSPRLRQCTRQLNAGWEHRTIHRINGQTASSLCLLIVYVFLPGWSQYYSQFTRFARDSPRHFESQYLRGNVFILEQDDSQHSKP